MNSKIKHKEALNTVITGLEKVNYDEEKLIQWFSFYHIKKFLLGYVHLQPTFFYTLTVEDIKELIDEIMHDFTPPDSLAYEFEKYLKDKLSKKKTERLHKMHPCDY